MACIPLLCSCSSTPKNIETPENYPDPPMNILCPRCNALHDTIYRRDKNRCEICFCCCLPCGTGNPYLACSRCGHNIGNIEIHRCSKCGVGTVCVTDFCVNCGQKKQ